MRKTLLILIVVFATINALAQIPKVEITPVSPEAAALTKMVNYPVSLNTGLPEISIPLYTLQSDGLTLPIAINYHSGGFRINEQSGSVGLGWSISTDIQITRTVYGLDDFKTYYGYLSNPRARSYSNGAYTGGYDFSSSGTPIGNSGEQLEQGLVDGMPDKFSYKLLNKSGSFYFMKSSNGLSYTIVPTPWDNIDIKFDNNRFIITDTDGTVYYFGAPGPINPDNPSSDGRELTIGYEKYPELSYRISAWKCLRIQDVTKSGVIYFLYTGKADNKISRFTENIEYYNNPNPGRLPVSNYVLNNQQFTIGTDTYEKILQQTPFHFLSSPKYFVNSVSGSTFHLPYLQYVSGNSTSTVFDRTFSSLPRSSRNVYTVLGLSLYQISFTGGQINFGGSTEQLGWISIKDAGYNEIKRIDFNSSYTLPNDLASAQGINGLNYQGTLYLDQLQMKGNGQVYEQYNFKYNQKTCFGNHLSGSDAWGYYNASTGSGSSSSNIPLKSITQNFYTSTNSGPTPNVIFNIGNNYATEIPREEDTRRGVLQRIVYPNGGYSDFNFESNLYLQSRFATETGRIVLRAGGLRIKSINFYDREQKLQGQKYYRYGEMEDGIGEVIHAPQRTYIKGKKEFDGFSYSQNIFYVKGPEPPAVPSNNYEIWNSEVKTTHMQCATLDYAVSGLPIYYTRVTEYNNDLGKQTGKKVHTFYDPLTFDISISTAPTIPGTNVPYLSPDGFLGAQKSIEDYKYENGKYQLIHSKEYTYYKYERTDQIAAAYGFLGDTYRITSGVTNLILPSGVIAGAYPIPYGKLLISGVNEKWINGTQTLFQNTSYSYNNLPYLQPSSVTTSSSKGENIVKTIKYAYDFPGVPIYDQMRSPGINMISQPVEETLTKAGQEISKTRSNYAQISAGFGYIACTSVQKSIKGNPLETEITFDKYDPYGNVLQTTDKNGLIKSYLWGYRNKYLVAEFTGVGYTQATASIDVAALQSITSEAQLKTNLSALRSANPSAMVSTFIHKPMVGVLTQTAPNDLDKNFEYDDYARLLTIKDHNKNILKKYSYKLPGFNSSSLTAQASPYVPLMASFSKICTPANMLVKIYNYIWPEGAKNIAENSLFSTTNPPEISPDTVNCVPISQVSQIQLAIMMQNNYAIPSNLYIDLIQDKSIVKSQKFPDADGVNKGFYLNSGQYKLSFRQSAIEGGIIIKFYVGVSDDTGFWIKSGEDITLQPGKTYSIMATNTF